MKKNTMLFEDLKRLNGREYLDAAGKTLLGYRLIAAYILKYCIEELESYPIKYISEKCIQGEPKIASVKVNAGKKGVPEKIPERNTEDTDADEGTVYYDVIFEVYIPVKKEKIKLIINLELQNKFNPGYPLVTRGIYYDARMISAQYGREFEDSEYGDIKKVYSVWVCINPDVNHRNTITRYHFTEENIFGNVTSPKEDYDKMEVILIGLKCDAEEKSENKLIDMLSTLFSKKMNAENKRKILEGKHGIKMKKEYNEVIDNMCNISGYYTQDYDEAMEKLAEMKARADDEKSRADEAESERDEMKSERDEMKSERDAEKSRADKAESERDALAAKLAALERQLAKKE